MTRQTFRDQVADYLRQHPNEWIHAPSFERLGGRQAWRTRLSECRTELGMTIENKQQRIHRADGSWWTISMYRYVPASGPVAQALPLGA